MFRWMSDEALNLAAELLDYNPERRITAAQALESKYFKEEEPREELPIG